MAVGKKIGILGASGYTGAELVRLSEAGLSRNALDIIGRALADPA